MDDNEIVNVLNHSKKLINKRPLMFIYPDDIIE